MSRIVGPAILAVGIICAPVMFAAAPDHSQAHPQLQPTAVKGDRLDAKPLSAACVPQSVFYDAAKCRNLMQGSQTSVPPRAAGQSRLA
jgi:hypothetical protein